METAALQSPARSPQPLRARLVVVKLGGSVVRGPELSAWLDAIAHAAAPVILVPGGGALADEVRRCQRDIGFGDEAAHRMALLAMDQLAWAVAGLRPGFAVGATEDALRQIVASGQVAVWAPYTLIANRTDIEESWRLTSDSLALWLAGRLGASRCCLIKSVAAPKAGTSARSLAREGVVDEAFPAMLAATGVPAVMFGPGDQHALAAALARSTPCGGVLE